MLILAEQWLRIREHFSEDEKAALTAAIDGETICPPGLSVDTDKLSPELRVKLTERLRAIL